MTDPNTPATFELSLRPGPDSTWSAEVRVTRPDESGDIRWTAEGLRLDAMALLEAGDNALAHGRVLHDMLFGDGADRHLRDAYIVASSSASRLRFRLSLPVDATALHVLRWEAMADPERPDQLLLQQQRVLFSRYPGTFDLRPLRPPPRTQLRAMVVVANPADLGAGKPPLAAISVEDELRRAAAALQDQRGQAIPITTITGPSTLDQVREALQRPHQILYLVCHGYAATRKGPQQGHWVYLEDNQGNTVAVSGAELALLLSNLDTHLRPWLVVLASCQSADARHVEDGTPLIALGPDLAGRGVPAVVAMQGQVLMETIGAFMPAFFRDLCEHGVVDHAVATGRADVDRD